MVAGAQDLGRRNPGTIPVKQAAHGLSSISRAFFRCARDVALDRQRDAERQSA